MTRQSILARALAAADRAGQAAALADDSELRRRLLVLRRRHMAQVWRLGVSVAGASLSEPEGAETVGLLPDVRYPDDELAILRLPRPAGFTFRPGQHVKLELEGVQRTYSIASAPHQPWLEFFVELHPQGRMTQRLRQARDLSALRVVGPAKGRFALDEARPNHLMFATVTGVSPFVSMLRDYFRRGNGGHVVLVHGASYRNQFGYREEFEGLASEHSGRFVYVPAVSRPDEARNAGWDGEAGRLDVLAPAWLDRAGFTPQDTTVYACGHPGMVEALATAAGDRGFPTRTEPY